MQILAPPRLGDILVTMGVIAPEQLQEALQVQSSTRQRLGTVLMSNGWATDSETSNALGIISGTTYIYHTDNSDVKITFVDDKVISTEGEFK